MGTNSSNSNKVILGAILGSIAVGASAAFLSSKTGKRLKEDASDKLEDIKDKVENFLCAVGEKSQDIADKAEDYSDKLHDFALTINDQIEALGSDEKVKAFLIGAVLGGMLGAGAASWLNNSNKEDFLGNIGNSAANFRETIQDILSVVEDRSKSHRCAAKSHPNSMQNVIDFALTGLELWQTIQSKKK